MNEPDHEDVAVGEVQELQDAVDERVAEGDERVGAPGGQPVERQLREGVPVHGRGEFSRSLRAGAHDAGARPANARGRPGIAPDRPRVELVQSR